MQQERIPQIGSLSLAQFRAILDEIFRFMYQNDDGTWDRGKEIPGTEMVSLLCCQMPQLRPWPGCRQRSPMIGTGVRR